jgi:hypothetical protein
MQKEQPQETTAQEMLNATQEEVHSIALDVDFKPYLDAVTTASRRTRSIIYVLIAGLLFIITAFRSTSNPDWTDSRLAQLQLASECINHSDFSSPQCKQSIDYAEGFISQGGIDKNSGEFKSELGDQIKEFIKQRTDGLTLHLPFFGITIDANDLGMVGGLILAAIFYVLYASLGREIDNIERAKAKAARIKGGNSLDGNYEDNLELILMSQVFSSPSKRKAWFGQGIYVLFLAVTLFHFFIIYTDLETYDIAVKLEGTTVATVETGLEIFAFALVLFFCSQCFRQQMKLNRCLNDLSK